jgi:hypothetical protein
MKKWKLELEIVENEDEFFQTLDYANQHSVLKSFVLDVLAANGFEPRVRLAKYEETYDDDVFESPKPKAAAPSA